jgi:hypothetical protein
MTTKPVQSRAEAVNWASVQGKSTFLPGETCCRATEVVTLAERTSRGSRSQQRPYYQLGEVDPLGRAERKVSLEWKVVGISIESRISLNGETTG